MVEQLEYKVLKSIGKAEIRRYPQILLAVVKEHGDDYAFGILFNYISGANKRRRKIKMTAPVITPERITMTSPVLSGEHYMAFVMPKKYTRDTLPVPTDQRVNIEVLAEREVATICFGGRAGWDDTKRHMEELIDTLKANNIEYKDEFFLMRYNSPFMPGFLRHNEIAVTLT